MEIVKKKKKKEALNQNQGKNSKYVGGDLKNILGNLRSSEDFEHFLLKIKLKNQGL